MKALILLLLPLNALAAGKIINADIAASGTANIALNKLAASTAHNACTFDSSGFIAGGVAPGTSGNILQSNGTDWASVANTAVLSLGAFGSTPNSNGLTLSSNVLNMQPADATNPGGVSTTTQTIAGAKTFSSAVQIPNGTTLTPGIFTPTGGGNAGFYFGANGASFGYNGGEISSFAASVWKFNVPIQAAFSGSAGSPSIIVQTSPNAGFYQIAANNWGWSAASAKVLDMSTAGLGVTGTLNVSGTTTLATSLTGVARAASGVISASELSGDVTTSGSNASTVAKIQGTTVSGTTGSTNVVFSSAPTMTNPVVGTQAIGDNTTKAASTAFVQAGLAQLMPSVGVYAASIANVAGTYVNAVSGVCIGDTFTTTATTAFALDGTSPPLNSIVLLKDQTNSFQDGRWQLTTQAVGGVSGAILTRALDDDSAADFNAIAIVAVQNGTVNAGFSYYRTNSAITTCNSDSQTWSTFQKSSASYASSTLTSAHLFVGNGSSVATDVAASGDVSLANTGAFTVSKVNGVSYGASPSTNTVPVVTSSNTITYETVPVAAGGSGLATLTAHALQVGNGTSNVTQLTVPASGTVLTGVASSDPAFSATPTLGVATVTKGTLSLAGNTSGTVTIQPAAAAGTWSMTLPTTGGSNTNILQTDGTGITSWVASTVTAPRSEIICYGGSGFGSTNTSVRRWTTCSTTGTDITVTQSATNGDSFAINTTAVYGISMSDQDTVGTPSYIITKNDTTTSNNFSNNRIGFVPAAAAATATANAVGGINLASGDVIRELATVTGNPQTANTIVSFRITKLSN